MKKTFYISTPIYYPSNKLTLGNCYTTVLCDTLAKFNRLLGKDVFFLTGTDEHGQKIAKIAKAATEKGITEIKYLDNAVSEIKELWNILAVDYDHFIRTTDDYHKKAVSKVFTKLYNNGHIYKAEYKGLYCTPCEAFWSEGQLVENNCPDCNRPVVANTEEAYFFKMQPFADKLKTLLQSKKFLVPEHKAKEMLTFINQGLQDICVSRTLVKWGIPVEFDQKHTIYVWIDALLNYVTALGYGDDNNHNFKKFWLDAINNDGEIVHVIGKEIARFHSIIFPAILLALELPLPKKIFSHGWMIFGNDKLSKSKSTNATEILDPKILVSRYGIDAVRLNLLKLLPFGQDAAYTTADFLSKYNQDLAGNYGNLVSRTFAMTKKYFNAVVPKRQNLEPIDQELITQIESHKSQAKQEIENFDVSKAISEVLCIFDLCNRYINDVAPWGLAKTDVKRLQTTINILLNAIAYGTSLLYPFIQQNTSVVLGAFNLNASTITFDDITMEMVLPNSTLGELGVLYPRADIQKELDWHIAYSSNPNK